MIYVTAFLEVKPGNRAKLVEEFQKIVPEVLAEEGCLGYVPTIDTADPVVDAQTVRPEVVTVVEQWESPAALKAHLDAPHMAAFRERVGDILENVTLYVTEPTQ
ncbi:Antibiotic biosynthesis monooxygenase [Planctomycetales bacterium 10988]|nr:Antibiotic biosynthesis monooxygenase [Planctomycetales bacterium 10988]